MNCYIYNLNQEKRINNGFNIDGIIKNFEEVNEKILDTEENLRTVKLPYNEYEEFEREIKRIEKAEKELQT